MNYSQLISDPSTYVKKRAQRSDDSILLRHMDDVVGTGPEEHLMSDFEHMKTSLWNGGGRMVGQGLHHTSLRTPCAHAGSRDTAVSFLLPLIFFFRFPV